MDDQMEPIRAREAPSAARPAPSWVVVTSAVLVTLGALARRNPASVGTPAERTADRAAGVAARRPPTPTPTHSPRPGWKDVLLRVFYGISEDRIMLIGAGVTYYVILALFPGIAAIISIYGLFANPSNIAAHLNALSGFAPGGGLDVLRGQLAHLAHQNRAALSFGFAISLLFSLWTANYGVSALFEALTAVYEEKEQRGFLKYYATTLAFTAGAIVLVVLSLAVMIALPLILDHLARPGLSPVLLKIIRWPILFILIVLALSVIYRYGPSRSAPQWHWITWGSAFAAVSWLAASALFSWYVANFGSYNKTYGSLGAIVGFMTWMWLSIVVILVGAKLDAEIERPTRPVANAAGSP